MDLGSSTYVYISTEVAPSKNRGEGGSSNMVGIMCPLVELGLGELPKTGRASMPTAIGLQLTW